MGGTQQAGRRSEFTIRHISVEMDRRDLNLPLESGINVLYGRNGVGKTRILTSIPKGCVTLHFDPEVDSLDGRFSALNRIDLWSDEPLVAAEAFSHDSLLSDGYWEEGMAGPFAKVVDGLRVTAERYSFVDELRLPAGVRARVWGVLLAVVGRDSTEGTDPHLLVEAIIEILGTNIVSIDQRNLTYRVLLSAETPALRTLVERTNQLLYERHDRLEATNWKDGGEGWHEWLMAVLASGTGGLLAHLVDNPFEDGPVDGRQTIGPPPLGSVALRERSRPLSLFEFIDEQSTDRRAVTESWFHSEAVVVDEFVTFAAQRITDDEEREYFEETIGAAGEAGTEVRQEALRGWFGSREIDDVDAFLFDLNGPTRHADALAVRASDLASELFARLLDGAPRLVVTGNPARVWESEGRFSWRAIDPTGARVTLDQLSATQRRWAQFAISLAFSSPRRKQIVLIDEPELGLHRAAEQHLLSGLHDIAAERDMIVIVASHSPAFLRPDLCTLHHVDREPDTKLPFIRPMGELQTARIAELGLVPSDLLQHVRTVLLVEGEHDRWVLDELFADQFARHGVLVIPMRGAKALKATADAQLLFDYTSARVLVMLDNESTERVEMIWNTAVVAQQQGASEGAIVGLLKELSDLRSVEGKALQEFCTRAITGRAADRVGFQMLSKADIIEYFAPDAFTRVAATSPDTTSWESLRAEHDRWCQANRGAKADFKEWLRRAHRARFDEHTFRRAVSGQDTIHDDFVAVLSRVTSN